MIKAKHIFLGSAIVSLLYTGNQLFSNVSKNFTHNLKFRVPLEKIGMKINLTQTIVNASLEIKNNYYLAMEVEGINMTVYMKNIKTGTLEEIASTQPNTKKYTIHENTTTNVNDIKVDVDNFTLLKNGLSNILNYQKGSQLFKILVTGYANGIPFTSETWY